MVWLPDHIWEKQKKGSGKGWSWGKSWGKGGGNTKPTPKDTSGGELGEYVGNITRQGNKYSFIQCEALVQAGYGDVFVVWDEMKAYKVGHKVKFTAYLDKEGRLQGKDLKSGLKDNYLKSEQPISTYTSGVELGEHIGNITRQGHKYSFIQCDALVQAGYGDVFVIWNEMKAYKQGMKVKFTAYLDKEGRLQGKDLKSG
eukprot:CAMPEP_0169257152 /NCGR_PEP_ID=MMETSP1016-20121227/40673_1 /TAXON_ID=342587 /ORGANISM="Karlodinium micrum, Strain CCMP2283" /LENGTH=198 /DNA_ID=CAMNT_0009338895 /DNA_START=43 /DNA_END=635 /DNA_ORIENTATION=+